MTWREINLKKMSDMVQKIIPGPACDTRRDGRSGFASPRNQIKAWETGIGGEIDGDATNPNDK
jgi:hypothetical protein